MLFLKIIRGFSNSVGDFAGCGKHVFAGLLGEAELLQLAL